MTDLSLAAYYSRRASEYERIYLEPERQQDLAALRERLRALLAGKDVLEVACGTGFWTEVIAPVARSVVATDSSLEALEHARRKVYPRERVRIETADAFALDRVAGRFDAGLAAFWWSHLWREEITRFLRSFHRRLDPGALVVLLDNRYVEGSSTPLHRTDDAGNTFQLRRLGDGSEHEVLKNFPTGAELRASLASLSRNLVMTELTYFWCASYEAVSA